MSELVPSAISAIAGGLIDPLDAESCDRHLAWLLAEMGATVPEDVTGLNWMLAHCDDGVTWGRYDTGAQRWHLGNQIAPEVSPPILRETLQELRIFGELREILIWREGRGFRGRILRETDPPANRNEKSNPLRPSDEFRVLRGDEVWAACEHDFSHIRERTGAEQVIPVKVTRIPRLHVRHYYQQVRVSGAIRVGATRLVKLTPEET